MDEISTVSRRLVLTSPLQGGLAWRWVLLAGCVLCPGLSPSMAQSAVREFCETETFQAQCNENEVIAMSVAKYGRMRIGRCVRKDLGYIGCFSNVLPIADRMCSGKASCEIRMPDPEFDQTKPCLGELKTYLEASYTCIKVLTPPRRCDIGHRWSLPAGIQQGYISNSVMADTSCADINSPLVIEVLPGQQINFTLLDFTLPHAAVHGSKLLPFRECQEYGVIFDTAARRKTSVCGGTHRHQQIYLSTNNSVELYFRKSSTKRDGHRILLHFKATGCVDITPGEDMWFRRYGSDAEIGCSDSREIWGVQCVQGEWRGTYGNCSASYHQDFRDVSPEPSGLHHGLTVVIIISLALGIGLLVLIGGIFLLKRFQHSSKDSDSGSVEMHRIGDLEEEEHLKTNQDNEKTEYKDILSEICGGAEQNRQYISILNRANDYIPSSFVPGGLKHNRPDLAEGDYGRCPNNLHVRGEVPVTLYAHSGGHRIAEPLYKTHNTDTGAEPQYGYNLRRCNQDCQGCHENCDYVTRKELRSEIKSFHERPNAPDKLRSPCYRDEQVAVNHRTVCDLHRHNRGHTINNSF